ncbi:ABC transporter permease [Nonomuraea sp. NPDC050328]|uniref:ABC transporter permease n=1 Tax=Nonomuraea sp. NPDC050328 TaxID=3364361 RepID=UPI00378F7399
MGTLIGTEVKLLLRSGEFLVVAVLFPAVFFLVMSEVFGTMPPAGFDMSTYMMISMAAFGAVCGAVNVGQRVAQEKQAGWNRQLRLTPLPGWSYVLSKVVAAMVVVLPCVALILLVGFLVKGVTLEPWHWLVIVLATWVGSIPFALLGLLIGLAAKPEAVAPLSVMAFLLLSMLGGLWMPVEILPSVMAALARALPSYWMAESARELVAGRPLDLAGMAVVAVWLVVCGLVVGRLYRRDAARA